MIKIILAFTLAIIVMQLELYWIICIQQKQQINTAQVLNLQKQEADVADDLLQLNLLQQKQQYQQSLVAQNNKR